VLGQLRVEEKTNEITALPELLSALDVSGCIVTVDALGFFDDESLLTVPADLPFGDYAVMIGLYQPQVGARQLADALIVAWVSVVQP
jgi:hypothetical protein